MSMSTHVASQLYTLGVALLVVASVVVFIRDMRRHDP